MTVDIARTAVITGDGVVARYPGLLCVARCSDREVLLKLLDVCAGAAGPDPGRALARRLARWMGGPDAPGDDLEFGTVATAGDELGVFLVGSVAVAVPGSPMALSGSDAATFTDRLISVPGSPVVLALDGARLPVGLAEAVNDLRAGVVPGAGAVLFPAGRAAARLDVGAASGLDGPTVRTAVPDGATATGATQVRPARPGVAPDGAVQNGAARNGTPKGGVSSLLADGSIGPDGDPIAGAAHHARPGARDARTPDGYEWFADGSGGGSPPDAGPDAALPGSSRWPWTDQPAEHPAGRGPGRSGADRPGRPGADRAGRLDDDRAGRPEDGRPGRRARTGPPTPTGGAARAARSDERPQVWIDPADPGIRDDPADQLHEGRHAILGPGTQLAALAGTDEYPHRPPVGPFPPPAEVGEGEHREAAPPSAAPAGGADDATPATAVAAVAAEPVVEDAAARETESRPAPDVPASEDAAPDDRAPDDDVPGPAPREGRVPPPAPQDRTGPGQVLPDAGGQLLHGLLCEDGHLNDPRSSSCVVCGAPVAPGEDVVGPRPPLGRIVFDDGVTFTVDAEYLVGRMPEADPRARSGELRPIVVEDRSGSVSRVHAEILINGWDVVLVDSGSRNGTFVAGRDESGWTPLAPGRTSLLLPGTRVRMGGRTFVFEPPVASG